MESGFSCVADDLGFRPSRGALPSPPFPFILEGIIRARTKELSHWRKGPVREPIGNCCIRAFVPLVPSCFKKKNHLTYLLIGLQFTRCIVTHETRSGSSRLQIWIPVSKYLERVSPDLHVLLTRAYVLDEQYLIVHSYATIPSRRIQRSLLIGWMEPFTHACSLESTLSSVIDLESRVFLFFSCHAYNASMALVGSLVERLPTTSSWLFWQILDQTL